MQARVVRELVLAALPELGFGGGESLGERLLVRDGCYAGIRFEFEEVSAIWLIEVREVRFVTDAGKVLRTIRLDDIADANIANADITEQAA